MVIHAAMFLFLMTIPGSANLLPTSCFQGVTNGPPYTVTLGTKQDTHI